MTHVDFSGKVKRVKFHYQKTSSDTDEWVEFGSDRIAILHSMTGDPTRNKDKKPASKDKSRSTNMDRETPTEQNGKKVKTNGVPVKHTKDIRGDDSAAEIAKEKTAASKKSTKPEPKKDAPSQTKGPSTLFDTASPSVSDTGLSQPKNDMNEKKAAPFNENVGGKVLQIEKNKEFANSAIKTMSGTLDNFSQLESSRSGEEVMKEKIPRKTKRDKGDEDAMKDKIPKKIKRDKWDGEVMKDKIPEKNNRDTGGMVVKSTPICKDIAAKKSIVKTSTVEELPQSPTHFSAENFTPDSSSTGPRQVTAEKTSPKPMQQTQLSREYQESPSDNDHVILNGIHNYVTTKPNGGIPPRPLPAEPDTVPVTSRFALPSDQLHDFRQRSTVGSRQGEQLHPNISQFAQTYPPFAPGGSNHSLLAALPRRNSQNQSVPDIQSILRQAGADPSVLLQLQHIMQNPNFYRPS